MANATSAVLLIGASDQRWGNFVLPLPLAAFGAGSCTLYVSPDASVTFTVFGGSAVVRTAVPNSRHLVGANLFHQVVVPSNQNTLGLAFTNAVRVRIAGHRQ